jgi:hypothetical protein
MRWIEALRIWNDEHKSKDCPGWTIPRKGTDDNKAVRAIMDEGKAPKSKKVKTIVDLWEALHPWITKHVEKKGDEFIMKSPYNLESDYEISGNNGNAEYPLKDGLNVLVQIILINASEIRIAKQKGKEVPKENWVLRSIELRYDPLDDVNIVAHPTNIYVEGTQEQHDELKAYIKKQGKPKGYPWRVNVIED